MNRSHGKLFVKSKTKEGGKKKESDSSLPKWPPSAKHQEMTSLKSWTLFETDIYTKRFPFL